MNVSDLIAACQWSPDPFILFSGNVFSPLIYYSHLTPIIVSLIFGIYVYISNRNSLVNRAFLITTTILNLWLVLDLVLWATNSIKLVLFAWSIVNVLEPIIYAGFVYFCIVFVLGKDVSNWTKVLLMLPLLPSILAGGTHWNVLGFDLTNCDRELIEGPFAFYNYIAEIGYSIWILGVGIWAWFHKGLTVQQRWQSTAVVGVILLLLLGFASGNIIGSFSEDWSLGQYGLFVIPICVGTLTYFIVQFRFFSKSQVMATQILVAGLVLAVGSIIFIQDIHYAHIVTAATLIFLMLLGFLLIKNFRLEVQQKTEIERLAKDLQAANDRLKQLDQMKSEFLSVASHQLRAPLTAIKGYVANISEGLYGAVPDYLDEPLGVVQESTRVMASSIEDYLNVSRIEQGRMKYEFAPVDITAVAERATDEMKPVAAKKGLTLSFIDSPSVTVQADFGKIKQVFSNLIDNAVKYTEQGGVTVSVIKTETSVRFMTEDTGIGIPPDEIGGLFSKFIRARGANQVNTTGTGLGLYVAKQLVEGQKGKIWAESDGAGKGSRFIVELPL